MRFEAINMKDTFKVWRLALIAILIGVNIFGLAYLLTEMPRYLEGTYTFMGMYMQNTQSVEILSSIIGVVFSGVVIDIFAIIFMKKLSTWEKDAKGYGLTVEKTRLCILCQGKAQEVEIGNAERFEVLPKNCEPHNLKSKWAEVGVIITADKEYKLYYLKGMQDAKRIFDANKAYQ